MCNFKILFFLSMWGILNAVGAGLPTEIAWKAPKNIILAPGQQQTVTFPAMKKKKSYILCLSFKAYLYSPKASGWNPYIAVSLNDTQLDKLTRGGNKRLFCRGNMFTTTHPKVKQRSWWGLNRGKPSIMTFIGPGVGEVDKRITSVREEGYNYFLDISDATNYLVIGADNRVESDKLNTLTLSNTISKQYSAKMHYDDIHIGYVKKDIANKTRGAILEKFKKGTPVAIIKGKSFTLQVMKSGGMLLENNGDKYWFKSLFSYPGDEKIQYSQLGIASSPGYLSWKPKVWQKDNKIEISAVNKNITLLRTITLKNQHISINDKLTNRANKPAGMVINNIIGVKIMPGSGSYRLSGMESNFENKCANNPTCFISQKNGSIGIVAEDNVFRFGLELLKRNNTFIISNKNLGIASGKSYTLEWTIYPLKSKQYFAMINKIRQAWGTNYTVPGPIGLFARDVINQKIRKTNIVLAPKNLWFEYSNGVELSRDDFKSRYDIAVNRAKKIAPSIKIMPRLETNLVTLDITKVPGGEIIPARKSDVVVRDSVFARLGKLFSQNVLFYFFF